MLLEVDLYRLATHGRLPSLETAMTTMYMLLIQIIKLLRTKALERRTWNLCKQNFLTAKHLQNVQKLMWYFQV